MQRREILRLAAMGAAAATLGRTGLSGVGRQAAAARGSSTKTPAKMPILDAHIHLFDPRRRGGVPWPTPKDTILYKPALPPRYVALSENHGVVGAIAIEASSLKSDNDWLLKVVAQNPVMVGMIGDLVPGTKEYMGDLERLHRDPLFLGIRYGNLWDRDLLADVDKPGFVDGLKELAAAGLVFESANPDARLMRAIRTVGERVPDLRIVVDHLPNAKLPTAAKELDAYWDDIHHLAQRPLLFVKLSEIPVLKDGQLVTDIGAYREGLDRLWDTFGEDRVLFGSDWPNSDPIGTYDETLGIVRAYVGVRSRAAQEKYFWKNSVAAYHWRPRRADQKLA